MKSLFDKASHQFTAMNKRAIELILFLIILTMFILSAGAPGTGGDPGHRPLPATPTPISYVSFGNPS